MRKLLRLFFIISLSVIQIVASSDKPPKMPVKHRPPKPDTIVMPPSENIAESMVNHRPQMSSLPVVIGSIMNRTPYLLSLDDESTFRLVGLVDSDQKREFNYPIDVHRDINPQSLAQAAAQSHFSIRLYDESGKHVEKHKTFFHIVQQSVTNRSFVDSDTRSALKFVISQKIAGNIPDDAINSSIWQLDKCKSCNVGRAQVFSCSHCFDAWQESQRIKSIRLDLLFQMKSNNTGDSQLLFGYKVRPEDH